MAGASWIWIVAGVVLLVFVFYLDAKRVMANFEATWPPIDDDEFVRRCSSGTSQETALKVRRIVAEQLGIPYDQVYPEQSFVNDLDCY